MVWVLGVSPVFAPWASWVARGYARYVRLAAVVLRGFSPQSLTSRTAGLLSKGSVWPGSAVTPCQVARWRGLPWFFVVEFSPASFQTYCTASGFLGPAGSLFLPSSHVIVVCPSAISTTLNTRSSMVRVCILSSPPSVLFSVVPCHLFPFNCFDFLFSSLLLSYDS